ncbi:MAG: 23S rRNA (uracil(1939)-C(5))-methyltransferase RlmD [Flavobacteriales bacterium]
MKKQRIVENVEIVDIGAKGHVIGKKDGVAYLCRDAVPGDVVTLQLGRNKKGMKQGRVQEITKLSDLRIDPKCAHFDYCGGCNWQNMDYAKQVEFKERRVKEQLRRIAGLQGFEALPIMGSKEIYEYRNKLEFTFVNQRWLTPEEIGTGKEINDKRAIGFHVPGRFDWVLHVDQCHLLDDSHNRMRNFLFDKARELDISFFDPKDKTGLLRNVLFRCNRKGQWMVLLVTQKDNKECEALSDAFLKEFPETHSYWIIENSKVNDSFSDCPARLYHGEEHIVETFNRPDGGGSVDYIIGPKSFFQTNSNQAERLYEIVYRWAGLTGDEVVYDLYTGTGSIALYVADKSKKIVGVEYVPEAIEDAKKNAELNGISNVEFYAGDMKDVLTAEFVAQNGKPDVIITDPPRAGMHEDVINRMLEAEPKRIVYVSCDPATQARDIKLLSAKYELVRIQPVDMFPHTSHVENVALLEIKDSRQ